MTLRWWHIVLIIFYVADLAYLHYSVFNQTESPVVTQTIVQPTVAPVDQCGPECQKYIDQKIASLPTSPPLPTISSSFPKTRRTTYLPLSVSGSTLSNDWVNVPGADFYFDTSDYPGLKEIYFEVTAKLFNGNGFAFVRLYDSTHHAGLPGSEVQTKEQKDTLILSSPIKFLSGKNLINVQIKSLTADTAIFTSGRLKIITEN